MNKCSRLDPTIDGIKFIIVRDLILVTLVVLITLDLNVQSLILRGEYHCTIDLLTVLESAV